MKDCKYYDSAATALRDIEELREGQKKLSAGHTELEASLKSVHIRMNDNDIIRKDTHDTVLLLKEALAHHMQWEESKSKLLMGVFSFVFVIAMAVCTWAFVTIVENQNSANINAQMLISLEKSVDKIDANVQSIKKIIYNIEEK